jgi:hypothetical protein
MKKNFLALALLLLLPACSFNSGAQESPEDFVNAFIEDFELDSELAFETYFSEEYTYDYDELRSFFFEVEAFPTGLLGFVSYIDSYEYSLGLSFNLGTEKETLYGDFVFDDNSYWPAYFDLITVNGKDKYIQFFESMDYRLSQDYITLYEDPLTLEELRYSVLVEESEAELADSALPIEWWYSINGNEQPQIEMIVQFYDGEEMIDEKNIFHIFDGNSWVIDHVEDLEVEAEEGEIEELDAPNALET